MKFDNEDIIYIKFVCQNIQGEDCNIKASVKKYGDRDILSCAKFDENLKIKTPQDISLSIICQNGIYKTNSILKFIEIAEPYVFFTIETPQEMEFLQNREYFRVKLIEEVLMTSEKGSFNCQIYDISASGIKLILPKEIDLSDNVNLNIMFTPKNIQARAKFIRKSFEKNVLTASFKFIGLSNSDMDIISKKCIQKQLQDKKNSLL